MTKPRNHLVDLRGVGRLAVEATQGVAEVVEAMHVTIAGGPALLAAPLAHPAQIATAPVYRSIRTVTRLVGATLDGALARLVPLAGESAPGPARDTVRAALNGVLGDYLSDTDNPLAITTQLHPAASRGTRLVVMLHGSSMSHSNWTRDGHNHAEALARDLGYAPIYLEYNSGLHISTNGRAFAALLEELVATWPDPIDHIVLIGHSMGGLVLRSACHAAERDRHAWRTKLAKLVTIGSPHHGAPLERRGNWVDMLLGISRYSAPLARLGKIRSAGVTDLRWGNVVDEDWRNRDRFAFGADPRTPVPLPRGVASLAIAGTVAASGIDGLPGDGLVPVDSALGKHARPELHLAFSDHFISHATRHGNLLSSTGVYEAIRSWLA
jgi:pimeloyl-ACP methyl ester carboxylesterase